jgi:hypothetical protein
MNVAMLPFAPAVHMVKVDFATGCSLHDALAGAMPFGSGVVIMVRIGNREVSGLIVHMSVVDAGTRAVAGVFLCSTLVVDSARWSAASASWSIQLHGASTGAAKQDADASAEKKMKGMKWWRISAQLENKYSGKPQRNRVSPQLTPLIRVARFSGSREKTRFNSSRHTRQMNA